MFPGGGFTHHLEHRSSYLTRFLLFPSDHIEAGLLTVFFCVRRQGTSLLMGMVLTCRVRPVEVGYQSISTGLREPAGSLRSAGRSPCSGLDQMFQLRGYHRISPQLGVQACSPPPMSLSLPSLLFCLFYLCGTPLL